MIITSCFFVYFCWYYLLFLLPKFIIKEKNKLKDIDAKLQYKIISATLDGQDQERNKISAILHDHVSAVLSSVGLHLSAFESSLTKEQIADLKKTRSLLKNAHDKVRDLSHELVPPLLVKFGLQFALRIFAKTTQTQLSNLNFILLWKKTKDIMLNLKQKYFL
ncbi:histidine kinase [Flavobacterium psychrophilum]|uniref:histidine kinase n=1 Tax=Flavobacterium psychrophilum TaxID=96345 RepID=UPI0039855ED3